MPDPRLVEQDTQHLARALLDHAQSDDPWLPDAAWWDDVLLDFCMRHPHLKAQLFRFVDVLPALPVRDVSRHLVEYLGDAREDLPLPLRFSLELPTRSGNVAAIVSRAARRNVARMARRFIAGSSVDDVVTAIVALRQRRLAVTLDALGEAVITDAEADGYRDQYVALLRGSARAVAGLPEEPQIDRDHDGTALPRVNVSVKLSALTPLFDPIDPDGVARAVVPRFRVILDAARDAGAFVHVDMENTERKDLTLAIFREVLASPTYRRTPHVGIVVQAYLRDAEQDLADLADWARRRGTPVWVRLVKGAYWDSETVLAQQRGWRVPVWEQKWETDACYERATDLLLDHADVLRPAFASHNVRSLARALAGARARGLPERFVELQALYGMADPLKAALAKFGQRVRVYTPFGETIPGMAYLVRRLLENTSNDSFVRREVAAGDAVDALVGPPHADPASTDEESPMNASPPGPPFTASFASEPLQDFSVSEVRAAFRAAVDRVASGAPMSCPVVVAGAEIATTDRLTSVNPSDTAHVVAVSASATAAEADLAVEAARAGAAAWRSVPAGERATVLDRAAELMRLRRNELAAWTCLEAGKTWRDADAEVAEAIDFCRFYGLAMRDLAVPERHPVPGEDNETSYAPRGPTVIISPWNFPLAILTGMATAALVTGNTVILKPAEQTPACAHLVFSILRAAGVPREAIHLVPGRGEVVGARLVEHPGVATIAFTGSRAVGHLIARRAAETSTGLFGIKRVVAEMGGKNAIVVDDDADLDEAVPAVLASAFGYAGQKCSACSRVIVAERICEAFVDRLASAARSWVVGPATDPAVSVGPLIDEEAVDRLRSRIDEAARTGRIVFRGSLGPGTERGTFVEPVIATDIPPGASLAQEELFGPLLVVLRARDFDEAIAIANSTSYALTGGIYSRSPAHIARARHELDVGNLYVNRKITGAFVARQPFGGHRHSGTGGKAGGRDYLLHFVDGKTITENTLRRGFSPEGT